MWFVRRFEWIAKVAFGLVLSLGLVGCSGCWEPPIIDTPGELKSDQPGNSLIFTDIQLGKSHLRDLLIYNGGGTEITVSSLEIVEDRLGAFKIVETPDLPFTLSSGEDGGKKIKLQFVPKLSAQVYTARLRLQSPDADNVDDEGFFYVKLRHTVILPDPTWRCGASGSSVSFGAVEKGRSVTKECVLQNRGNAELVLTSVEYSKEKGGARQDFRWDTPFPIKVGPGKETTVRVTYTPSDYPPREDQGDFVFVGNIGTKGEDKLRLKVVGLTAVALVELIPLYSPCQTDAQCRAIDSRLRCTRDELSKQTLCMQGKNTAPVLKFPLTSKGKTTRRVFLVRSVGDLPLAVRDIRLDDSTSKDFRLAPGQRAFSLNPAQEKQVAVEYTPSDEQPDRGKLLVESNAGNLPRAPVLLEAASRGCNIEVQPRKIDFPGPKEVEVTVFNKGNESCVVKRVYLKGNSEHFSLLPLPKADQTLVPLGRFSFLVRFRPRSSLGGKVTEFIAIESTDPDEPKIEVELSGQPSTRPECSITTSPTTLNFSLVPVGRSRKIGLTVKNQGWGDCDVSALELSGTLPSGHAAFSLSNTVRTPLRMPAGGTLRLDISFTPPAERPGYEGILSIRSNDAKQPDFRVKLIGASGSLCLEVVPAHLDFGSSKFGCATPKRTIEVFNLGSAKCTNNISVTGIKLANNANGEFRLNSAPRIPQNLGAGQSMRIELSYKPKDLGVDTATLNIENSVAGQSPIPVPLIGEGVATNEQKDVFKQLKRPLSDILFVVDDSCSMGEEQASLAKNFQYFINWAIRLKVDYQIMVTTTDVTGRNAPAGCARGATKIVTPQTPNPASAFAQNVRVGITGSATEKGLEAAYRALIAPASTGCNKGFYRKDASLSIIFVSDEPDQSPQTVQFYLSFFKSLKGLRNQHLLRAFSIVGPPPSGCRNPGTGNAASAPRYWEVAQKLKGLGASLCASDWAAKLSGFGAVAFAYRSQFFLSRQADPKTIQVKVNGVPVSESPNAGWRYDASSNSVFFSKSHVPSPGATIEIQYKAICLP